MVVHRAGVTLFFSVHGAVFCATLDPVLVLEQLFAGLSGIICETKIRRNFATETELICRALIASRV